MSKLFFIALTALLAIPSLAFEQYWAKQHCVPTSQDTMNVQIYLKWSNMNLLDNYVHHGNSRDLPFDIESLTDIAETQNMWRMVLRPTTASLEHVQLRMTLAGFPVDACEAQWDSLHCKNVPVGAVGTMFGVEMCAYKQDTARLVSALPHLAGRRTGGIYWLANVKKAALRNEHIQYVGGVALFDPTVVPRRHEAKHPSMTPKKKTLGDSTDPAHWPLVGNAPVVLMGMGLPEFGSLSELGVVQVALFCKDGSIANYTRSGQVGPGWCPTNVSYPKSLIVTVGTESVTLDFGLDCMSGPFESSPYSNQAICMVNANSLVPTLRTWGVYTLQATTIFNDGSKSTTATMQNFWDAQYMAPMQVTIPNPLAPVDIRTLYNIDSTERLENNESAQGILEFSDTEDPRSGFLVSDLRQFLIQYNVVTESEADAYIAKYLQQVGTDELESRGETSLDIEMMMSLARTGKTYLWNIVNGPGMTYVHWAQGFLAWAQNVTSGTGPSSALPPSVWSISYGGPEWDTPNDSAAEAETLNNYFKMMTASGVTVAVSSGDSGAGFIFGNEAMAPLVSYPASSPYVVAVGASANQVDPNSGDVVQAVCSAAEGNVITSGGGFSVSYGMLPYQEDAVTQYYHNFTKGMPSTQMPFGRRGLPDVAAIGAWVNIVISNSTIPVFGTSISAPVFSSLLSLANDHRRRNGNSTVKLANWMVYRAPAGVFNDVLVGSNCAGEQGGFSSNFATYPSNACYNATPAWDPASGIGTPMYPPFAAYAVKWSSAGIPLPTGNGGSSSNHAGAIAGGVIGGVAGLAIIGFIVFKVCNKPSDGADYQQI